MANGTATPNTPALAAPPPLKPGWQTSEFYLHLAAMAAIAVLTYLTGHVATLGLPPYVTAIVLAVGPAAIAWLQREYADNRTELKAAQIAAAAQIPDPASAAAKLATP